jgi:H+/Na+-translocating ferredoxin:NAD+ oxidoreductase subunit E
MQPPSNDFRTVVATGLWRNNVALVQLLGLCPLLAVTTSLVNGLALGLATAGVLTLSNAVLSLARRALLPIARLPLYLLVAASLVTCVDLLSNAVLDELHEVLGLFIPLIVANCAVVAQAEAVAGRRGVVEATLTGLATGIGFLGVLVALGALRELLGRGTLLAGLPMLAGPASARLAIDLPFDGMLVAILPPGAFFGMALLLALRNALRRERNPAVAEPRAPAPDPAR